MTKTNFIGKDAVRDYLSIIIGTALVAIGVTVFYEPCNLVTGGVTGLALIIADAGETYAGIHIPLWLTNIVLNIPLLLVGLKVNGKDFLARTLFATAFLSVALSFSEYLPKFGQEDFIISAVFGGVLCGAGMALVFRSRTTTGGTDIAASVLHAKFRHLSIARILFVIDTGILAMGFFAFGAKSSMYAVIPVYITSKITDTILEGVNFAKAAFVISDQWELIAEKVMEITERGATSISAKGVYTGNKKNVLLLVMSNKELVIMKDVIKSIDPSAFVIVTDVREVLGEGFQRIQ